MDQVWPRSDGNALSEAEQGLRTLGSSILLLKRVRSPVAPC